MKTKTRSAAARKRTAVTPPAKPAVTRQAGTQSIDLSDCASAGYQPLSGFKK